MAGAGKDTPIRGIIRKIFLRPELHAAFREIDEDVRDVRDGLNAVQDDLATRPERVGGALAGVAAGTDKAILKAVCDALNAAGIIDSTVTTD